MNKKGSSLLETRRWNRVLIKNMIFRTENATRTGIAEALGLTLPTITTSVNEMLSEGILEEIPMAENNLVNGAETYVYCLSGGYGMRNWGGAWPICDKCRIVKYERKSGGFLRGGVRCRRLLPDVKKY